MKLPTNIEGVKGLVGGRRGDSGPPSLSSLLLVLIRRWKVIALGLLVVLSGAAIYLVVAPSRYTASAIVMPDTRRTPPSPTEAISESVTDPVLIDTQMELLKSDRIATAVVDKLGLREDWEFTKTINEPSSAVTSEMKTRAAINYYVRNLAVTRVGRSYVAEISFTSGDPEKSAAVANASAEAFIQDQLDSRFLTFQRAAEGMQRRVVEQERVAEEAARAAAAHRAERGLVLRAGQIHGPSGNGTDPEILTKAEELEAFSQSQKSLKDVLVTRYQRASQFAQQSFPITEARILTPATPPTAPTSPKLSLTLLLAIVAGGTIGIAGAFAREYFDRSIRDAEQIESELGVRCLAVMPPWSSEAYNSSGSGLKSQWDSWRRKGRVTPIEMLECIEVLEGIKLAMDRSAGKTRGKVIGIASPNRTDSTQVLVTSLAMLAERGGEKALVLGYAPAGHASSAESKSEVANGSGNKQEPDLTGGSELRRHALGFSFLSGAVAGRIFKLLTGRKGTSWLKELQIAYDYILIDLSPAVGRVDAAACADSLDGFLLIADAAVTSLDDVACALRVSDALRDRLIGVVVVKRGAVAQVRSI